MSQINLAGRSMATNFPSESAVDDSDLDVKPGAGAVVVFGIDHQDMRGTIRWFRCAQERESAMPHDHWAIAFDLEVSVGLDEVQTEALVRKAAREQWYLDFGESICRLARMPSAPEPAQDAYDWQVQDIPFYAGASDVPA